ncbi:MAG: hypothetical protein NT168_15985 [Planctomycetota bacterium]|nr:hypothetical protein [Planctomycetota bacterium]
MTCQDRRNFLKRASVGAWIGSRLIAGLAVGSGLGGCSYLQQTRFLIPSIPLDKKTQLSNDYFRIKSEQRASRDATQWLEGRMETYPEIGATLLEPWRKDTAFGFQRIQSTLQTIRRTCFVRAIPIEQGFSVGVEVIKELEDVDRSQYSSEGSAIARHDGTIVRASPGLVGQPITLGWIRQENDTELEQRILREILGRSTNVSPPRRAARTFK